MALGFFLLAGQIGVAGEFPWIDPIGLKEPVLLCANEPTEKIQGEYDKFAEGKPGKVIVVRDEHGDRARLVESPEAIFCFGELDDVRRGGIVAKLNQAPNRFAVCLPPQTGLAIHRRRVQCVGEASVVILLAAGPGRPLLEIELKPGTRHDWTMLRRAAIERSLANFPPVVPPVPYVASGALLIVGGGEMPKDVTDRFIELAGGLDAPIVVLPIAAEDDLRGDENRDSRVWTRVGAKSVRSLRARTREEVESPEFAATIEGCKAVWFSGGRQWRFVDAYMGTKAEDLFRGVLARGGVIGGSSAGASIQGQYMPRGSPLGNTDMIAEGYERGLGFLPGAAVDQHFTQRKRYADMTALMRRYPQLLGIGLDEGTAIVVQSSTAQIMGRGGAHFYDYRTGQPAGERDYQLLHAGSRYDLANRREVIPQ